MAKPESPADFGKTAFPSFAGLVRSRALSKYFFIFSQKQIKIINNFYYKNIL
jgi:hypothetical protein